MRAKHVLAGTTFLVALAAAAGCILAAAGAGAGGAIYLTDRGVESVVPASVEETLGAAEQAFGEFDIERTSYEEEQDGAKRELEGRSDDKDADVAVHMEATEGGNTRVEVTAKTSPVTWDKDFAREILERIVELAE